MDADVVVIGGGVAGLAAARSLRGLRVVLLEARDRFGGRVWTTEIGSARTPVELGAEFIHGTAERTMQLLREAGSGALDVGGDEDDDVGFGAAAAAFSAANDLAHDESVDAFLHRFSTDAERRALAEDARELVMGFDAVDPARASVKALAEEWASGVDSVSARPRGGYRRLVDYLEKTAIESGAWLRLSNVVRTIEWERGRVCVTSEEEITARAAIVTVPVGVLRAGGITFAPDLPPFTRSAIESIEMGSVVRVVLGFRTAFWEDVAGGAYRETGFFRGARAPFSVYWTQLPSRRPAVVAWVGGPRARALATTSRNALIELALDGFGEIIDADGEAHAAFEEGAMHDWDGDPYARGAYSYATVGAAGARANLAEPVGQTLYFAGEALATGGHGGTVEGAILSGERAAAALRAAL